MTTTSITITTTTTTGLPFSVLQAICMISKGGSCDPWLEDPKQSCRGYNNSNNNNNNNYYYYYYYYHIYINYCY